MVDGPRHGEEEIREAVDVLQQLVLERAFAELDHGAIVMQAAVPVLPGDDAKALAARVLVAEHRIYPQSVRWFVEDALVWDGERVHHRDGMAQQLLLS